MSLRPVKRLIQAKPGIEGAGVHFRRAFGFNNTGEFDPFLLLDHFRNDIPQDYLAGFPWHPHRGIETIAHVLAGTVEHGDSMRNHGAIGAGNRLEEPAASYSCIVMEDAGAATQRLRGSRPRNIPETRNHDW